MAIVVVGGHTKNVGKTSVVAGLVAALPEMRWTAFKITQSEYEVCPDGGLCECENGEHRVAVREEARNGGPAATDSARFLAAGAVRSLWVRTRPGDLEAAMPRIRRELGGVENAVIESNSILAFLKPDLYLSVLDPGLADFKDSARYFLDRADAVLVPEGALLRGVLLKPGTSVLAMRPPVYVTDEVVGFVRRALGV